LPRDGPGPELGGPHPLLGVLGAWRGTEEVEASDDRGSPQTETEEEAMSTAADLRAGAQRLNLAIPPQRHQEPPRENGRRVATIRRSELEEIRLNLSEYEGKPYVSIRMWSKNAETGQWWPVKEKGLSIRIRELEAFAEGIARMTELVADQFLSQPRQGRPPLPGRRVDVASLPPPSAETFNEFEEA
jgi:Transcriptional Coactivator p15 (PC4)